MTVVEICNGKKITLRVWDDEFGGFRCYHIKGIHRCFKSLTAAQRYLSELDS